jgi:RNA polymerase sigma factor (sigma-70 family)
MRRSSKSDHPAIKNLLNPTSASRRSDADLLDQFRSGSKGVSEDAFESLVRRHGPMVLSICRRALGNPNDAEDAFQATFFVLATRARSIRTQRSVGSWLHGVALRVASRLRTDVERRRLRERESAEVRNHAVDRGITFVDDDFRDDEALHQEIQKLPSIYREVIVLCYLQGMTQEAAAVQLGCPPSTVGVRLMRARKQLEAGLSRRGISRPGGGVLASLLLWYTPSEMPKYRPANATSLVMSTGGKLSPAAARIAAEILKGSAGGILKGSLLIRRTGVTTAILVAALATASFGGVATGFAVLARIKPWERPAHLSSAATIHSASRSDRERSVDADQRTRRIESDWSNRDSSRTRADPAVMAVPEPSTLVIAATASILLAGYAFLRRGQSKPSGASSPGGPS